MLKIIFFLLSYIVFSQNQTVYEIEYLVTRNIQNSKNDAITKNRLFIDDYAYRYEFVEELTEGFEHSNLVSDDTEKYYSYHIGKISGKVDYHLTNYPKKSLNIVDSLPSIKWKISSDTKKVGSFNCTRAVGNYRGRVIEAYFTTSVPISIGPNNLNGLPGAVILATSHDGDFQFEATKLKKIKRPDDFVHYSSFEFGDLTSVQDYLILYDSNLNKQISILKNRYRQKAVDLGAKESETTITTETYGRGFLELFYEWQFKNDESKEKK